MLHMRYTHVFSARRFLNDRSYFFVRIWFMARKPEQRRLPASDGIRFFAALEVRDPHCEFHTQQRVPSDFEDTFDCNCGGQTASIQPNGRVKKVRRPGDARRWTCVMR
jgi:hypothetical protein